MTENSIARRFALSPTSYGIASLIAACLSWASFLLVFAMGPDGILNNRMFGAFAFGFLPLFGLICGLIGVGMGFCRRKWLAMISGAIGLGMIGWFVLNV